MAQARYFGWEGNQGDGIALGRDMGGAVADMDAYQGLGLLADRQGIDLNPRFLIEGGIQVNRAGQRFSHELADVSGQGARVIAQPEGLAWVIYHRRSSRCASPARCPHPGRPPDRRPRPRAAARIAACRDQA